MFYTPETYNIEKTLVTGCRTGEFKRIRGTKKKGLENYKRLIYNNINNAIKQAYPIAYKVISKDIWKILINEFIKKHDSQTPQIWKMPGEFAAFVKKRNYRKSFDLPYLNDLLNFEWSEIEVHTMNENSLPKPKSFIIDFNTAKQHMVINPVHKILELNYPIHLYSVEEAKNHKDEYFLVVYRTKDFKVKFVDLPVLHFQYLNLLKNGKSLKEVLDDLKEFNLKKNEVNLLKENFYEFIVTLIDNGIIINSYQKHNYSN